MSDWRRYYESKGDAFDEYSATYGTEVALASIFYRARRDAVISALPAAAVDIAVELGTGSGVYLAPLRTRSRVTVAVDIATSYLRQALLRTPGALGVQADAVALPFASASVGIVLASEVIEHLVEPTSLLDEVARILTPRGTIVLTTPNPLALHDVTYRLKRRIRRYDVNEHPGLMAPWLLRRELLKRNLEIEAWRTCNFVWPYPIGETLGRLPRQDAIARASEAIERRLQTAPVARRLGWTQVVVARNGAG